MAGEINIIRKRGRSLSIVSSGVILYIVAGGQFTDEGAFLGGGIKFDHPEYLEIALIVVMIYFFFRYYLSNRGNWPKFKQEIIKRLGGDRRFKKEANKLAENYIRELIENKEKIGGQYWHDKTENIFPKGIYYHKAQSPIKFRDRFQPTILVRANRNGGGKLDDYFIDINKRFFFKNMFRVFRRHLRYNEDFWDKIFPYILSYIAGLFILFEMWYRFSPL